MRTAAASLRADGLRLVRDRFLVGTSMYIVGISVAMRWAIPYAARSLKSRWGFELLPYYPLLVSHFVIQLAPLLVGVIGAFLLLESREDRTVEALLVSPIPLWRYLAWMAVVMALASTALTLLEGPLIGLGLPPWPGLLAAGFVGALAAPGFALFVAAVAADKTEAFAYLKIVSVAPVFVSAAYFLDEPVQWVAAIYPPYWAVKAYWVAEVGGAGWLLWAAGGVVVSVVWVALSARLFIRSSRS